MNDLVEAARKYIGVKFQHQGRTRRGCDCLGLVVMSMRDIGMAPNDRTDYNHKLVENELLNGVLEHCKQNELPEVGCLALFELEETHQQHVAIVTAINPVYIIHAYAPVKAVCEHRLPGLDENGIYVGEKNLKGYFIWR